MAARAVVGLLSLLLLFGCARPAPPPAPAAKPTRDDLVVLLPDQDGKTGALSVAHAGTERVLDTPRASAKITEEGRIETGTATPEEVQQVFGAALAAQPPRPMSFSLYFFEGKDCLTADCLTAESQVVLQQVLAEIARRQSPEIVVIGHTDRVGSVTANDALSLRRARNVEKELVKLGIPADRIDVAGRGEREPLVPTDDEVAEPKNRRVEISVR